MWWIWIIEKRVFDVMISHFLYCQGLYVKALCNSFSCRMMRFAETLAPVVQVRP